MIIEIIVIILSFLFPAYLVYKYSGEENEEQQIVAPGNEGGRNHVINKNNENNENNESTNKKNNFKKLVMKMIENKEKYNLIDWGDIETTANNFFQKCIDCVKKWVQEPKEEIKKILNEERLKRGNVAVEKWIDEHKEEFNNEKDIQKIVVRFHDSGENTYTFKTFKEGKEKEEEKKLLTGYEIIGFLNKIKEEELFKNISDGEVLQNQEYAMKQLEKEDEKKQEKLKEKKLREQEEKLKEKKRLKDIEDKAKEAQGKIVDEPQGGDPDATTICFRYPDGEKTKTRRFLKTHKIQNLYDYVTSLGNEIYSEEGNNGFSLCQPFPAKKYTNMENTLEKEGLSPNAVIQIKEE